MTLNTPIKNFHRNPSYICLPFCRAYQSIFGGSNKRNSVYNLKVIASVEPKMTVDLVLLTLIELKIYINR